MLIPLAMAIYHSLGRHPLAGLAAAFAGYEAERHPDTDALAEMALDNYVEMRAGVVDDDYLARRSMALDLEQRHPLHLSPRYNMVMFSTMPLAEARDRAATQARLMARARREPAFDIDDAVRALPPLPQLDPLADPDALSIS